MASYVKSLDNKHLLEIGMEGFYGDLVPDRKSINPGYQVGTDFISSNLIKEIDFATIHAYTDQWYVELFLLHNSYDYINNATKPTNNSTKIKILI